MQYCQEKKDQEGFLKRTIDSFIGGYMVKFVIVKNSMWSAACPGSFGGKLVVYLIQYLVYSFKFLENYLSRLEEQKNPFWSLTSCMWSLPSFLVKLFVFVLLSSSI